MQDNPASTGSFRSSEKIKCYHCGEICQEDHLHYDQKDFCCSGCKTVYEILSENQLDEYYQYQQHPGTSRKSADQDKFFFLDHQEIQQQLLDFSSDNLQKIALNVPQVHCSSCIWLLENLHRLNPGILTSRVNFVRKEVYVDFDPKLITLRELVQLLASVGYEPQINLASQEQKKNRKISNSLLLKIGVSGFAFGNIMLLSFTDYLGIGNDLEAQLRQFIYYLNLALALPVILYSGRDYFISAWQGLRKKFLNIDVPIAAGILVLFLRSSYEIITDAGPGYFDSLAGLVFFLLIGRWFQSKTYENLSFERDYKAYFPLAVNRITDTGSEIVQVNQLKKDDQFYIRNQEIVPCDSILKSGEANIDYSFVTGESKTVNCKTGDQVYAGGKQVGPKIHLQAIKEVSQSYLTRLWNHDAFQKEKHLPQHQLVNRISKHFTIAILTIGLATFAYWYFIDLSIAFSALAAVLIVACPCALTLSTPFTLGSTTRLFGRNKFYLKNAGIIESMASIDHIVLDKTGTLSQTQAQKLSYQGKPLDASIRAIVHTMTGHSTHPLSREINRFLKNGTPDVSLQNFAEIQGQGLKAGFENRQIRLGSQSFVQKGQVDAHQEAFLNEMAAGVFLSIDNELLGRFEYRSTFREGIRDTFRKADKFKISLLSGDHDHEKQILMDYLPENTNYLFRQKPEDKLDYIKKLQQRGDKVMMVGDGLNDAGALRQSEVGIAVTDDISAFSPASDGILDGSALPRLLNFIRFSGLAKKVIIASFIISFLYNVVGLAFAVAGALTPVIAAVLMPLSSITVVVFTTGMIQILGKRKKLI